MQEMQTVMQMLELTRKAQECIDSLYNQGASWHGNGIDIIIVGINCLQNGDFRSILCIMGKYQINFLFQPWNQRLAPKITA